MTISPALWRRSSRSGAVVRYTPNRAVPIFGEQQRAIFGLRDADRPAPNSRIIDYEAGDKILVFSGGHPILHDAANDFITGSFGPVP